jgi:cobalt-zinc-cadmium efflux system outer membrane protein
MLAGFQMLQAGGGGAAAQTVAAVSVSHAEAVKDGQAPQDDRESVSRYVDAAAGTTADEAVAYALTHNAELIAARKEVDAARALVKQAGLKPNPKLDIGGSRQINGKDNSLMVEGRLPLELGGRRAARVRVAEREVEVREQMVADRERQLSAEVRAKFGEALAGVLKLGFAEELLLASRRGYRLVVARVVEGRTAPLEQNMVLVEVNRLRSVRETDTGAVEVAMLELRNLMGMSPEEPLRLRGDFANMIDPLPPIAEATQRAQAERPDVLAARAAEALAEAQVEQARAEGRPDADLTAGYQRMNTGFPVNGVTDAGQLRPVQDVFHYVTFGVSISLPLRNKNQGSIEAAAAGAEAARRRREFLELTVRREVAAGYARYEHAARAAEIYRVGVRGQADANLEVVRKTYELGSKTLLDYISEQRRFIELEGAYIDALLDTYRARVEIGRATGSPELIKR